MLLAGMTLFNEVEVNMHEIKDFLLSYKDLAKRIEIEYVVNGTSLREALWITIDIARMAMEIYGETLDDKISFTFDGSVGKNERKISLSIFDEAIEYVTF